MATKRSEPAFFCCDPNATMQRAALPPLRRCARTAHFRRELRISSLGKVLCRLHYKSEVERGRLSSALAFSTSSWLPFSTRLHAGG